MLPPYSACLWRRGCLLNHCIFELVSDIAFLSAGYAAPLALLLILCFFLLLKREQYILAATFAGLTFATRSTGLVLLPVIIWELWCKFVGDHRRFFLMHCSAQFSRRLAFGFICFIYGVLMTVRLRSQPTKPRGTGWVWSQIHFSSSSEGICPPHCAYPLGRLHSMSGFY